MLIFLVVTHYCNGQRNERAFSSHHAARAYAARQSLEGESEMLEVAVMGELSQPGLAYTIRWNDLTPDTHNVEGIYGSYELARLAVGNQGHVQELRIETGADAANDLDGMASAVEAYGQSTVINFYQAMTSLRQNRARRQRAALLRLA